MIAENVLPIIEALDDKERQRLMLMLETKTEKRAQKKLKHWSEKEIRQKLLSTIFKPRRV
jgi:hypothetical protein